MRKLVEINAACNTGSTGHIAEAIGRVAQADGWEVWIAHSARYERTSKLHEIRIQPEWMEWVHGVWSILTGLHGRGSWLATMRLVWQLKKIDPDVVVLHNIHGYYINYVVLMKWLKKSRARVIWALHDMWSMTGHCAYFSTEQGKCERWQTGCYACPKKKDYPQMLMDQSKREYANKKQLFTELTPLTMIPVSQWMENNVRHSYFHNVPLVTIPNGVDLTIYRPHTNISGLKRSWGIKQDAYIVLAVASEWNDRKGWKDILKLRLKGCLLMVVGVSEEQCDALPPTIRGLVRTDSVDQLAELYALADVFINPTYSDTYPTTNLEALASGTPVITYETDGSSEVITEKTGVVVPQGDINAMKEAIYKIKEQPLKRSDCRKWAEENADEKKQLAKWMKVING